MKNILILLLTLITFGLSAQVKPQQLDKPEEAQAGETIFILGETPGYNEFRFDSTYCNALGQSVMHFTNIKTNVSKQVNTFLECGVEDTNTTYIIVTDANGDQTLVGSDGSSFPINKSTPAEICAAVAANCGASLTDFTPTVETDGSTTYSATFGGNDGNTNVVSFNLPPSTDTNTQNTVTSADGSIAITPTTNADGTTNNDLSAPTPIDNGSFAATQTQDQLDATTVYNSDGSVIGSSTPEDFENTIQWSHLSSSGTTQLDSLKLYCWGESRMGLTELNTRFEVRKDKLPAAWTPNQGDAQAESYPQRTEVFNSIQLLDDKRGMSLRKTAQAVDHWYYLRVSQVRGVGPGATHPTLKDAFEWVEDKRLVGEISLIFQFTAGDHQIDNLTFSHPDAHKISLRGTGAGLTPTNADMTGDEAVDEAFIRSIYPSVLVVDDAASGAITGGAGLHLSDGIGDISDLAIISNGARYMITIGAWVNSWETTGNGAVIGLDNIAFHGGVGGVWGMIISNSYVINKSKLFFSHFQGDGTTLAGGAFLLRGGNFVSQSADKDIQAYIPNSIYLFQNLNGEVDLAGGVTAEGMYMVAETLGKAAHSVIVNGNFSEGRMMTHTSEQGGTSFTNCTFTDFDARSQTQQLWVSPSYGFGALLVNNFVGSNSTLDMDNCTMSNIQSQRFLYNHFGNVRMENLNIDNYNFTHPSVGGGQNVGGKVWMSGSWTNPVFSSNFTTSQMGHSNISGLTGITSSPAIGTLSTSAIIN